MSIIDLALESEYNNFGELMGLGALDHQATEMLQRMDPIKRATTLQKIVGAVKSSRLSRAEFEKFFREVPNQVREQLLLGKLRLADWAIYSWKKIASKTVKMFESQDDKETGIRNIANAKLPKNVVFLVSGIYMLTGIPDAPSDPESLKAIAKESISTVPALTNATFELKANKRQIVPEDTPTDGFVTNNNHLVNLGYYKLDNPRLLRDEELLEFTVELGSMYDVDADQHLYVALVGTGTTP